MVYKSSLASNMQLKLPRWNLSMNQFDIFIQAGVIQAKGISTTDTGIAFRKVAK